MENLIQKYYKALIALKELKLNKNSVVNELSEANKV